MSADLMELGRRAVACKGWRWMPGMLVTGPGWLDIARICDVDTGIPTLWEYRGYARGPGTASSYADDSPWEHPEAVPVLGDEATLGCLLALVREAWGPAYGTGRPHLRPTATGWLVASCGYPVAPEGLTEAEALVSALECAP